jgi:hypothetical protein
MSTEMARIAANIEAELRRQCMSVEVLAYAVGMSQQTFIGCLNDPGEFYANELVGIADYLGVGIAALLR